jgi:hypothetical protein
MDFLLTTNLKKIRISVFMIPLTMVSSMNWQGTLEHDHYMLSWQLGNKTLCSSSKFNGSNHPFGYRATSKIVRHLEFI